jgi:hypothetical protein
VRCDGVAFLIGDSCGRGTAVEDDAVFVLSEMTESETDGARRQVGKGVDLALVDPFAGDAHRDIRLVLVIGVDHLDWHAKNLAAEILDRHLGGEHRASAIVVRIWPGHVGDDPDLNDTVGNLGLGEGLRRGGNADKCEKSDY